MLWLCRLLFLCLAFFDFEKIDIMRNWFVSNFPTIFFFCFDHSLRLQIYRSLGIEMLENDLGAYTKARVRK